MKKQKILIVDDSKMNREILSSILEESYQILEAENGLQAIEILGKSAQDFSLILLDIVMPECDGYGVLSFMSESRILDDIPVVVISSETDQTFISKACDMGAVDFISRPFRSGIVKRRVKNTITLYEKQRRLAEIIADEIYEKTKSYDLMVSVLSQVVEFRNQESELHVMHIRAFSEMLAEHLMKQTSRYGLTAKDVQLIGMASALHDIEKITIPDLILNKPDSLAPEEFEIMKTHAAKGAEMLEQLSSYQEDPLISMARDICRYHHERYDGKGYPDGLVGDAIPVSAQIVSIADVYDALTSERCYKKAYSHETAIQMIQNGACGAFNPVLLKCLTEIADQLPGTMSENIFEMRERQELAQLTDKLSNHEELTVSALLIRRLQFEQSRADYFEAAASNRTFVYRNNPPMLMLSHDSAQTLGLKEVLSDISCDETFCQYAGVSPEEWHRKLLQASPEHPDFIVEGHLRENEQERDCCLVCHTVWIPGKVPHSLGTMGMIQIR